MQGQAPRYARSSPPRSARATFAALGSILTAIAGCGPDAFAPPPPAELRPSAATSTTGASRAREIALILPAGDNGDFLTYEAVGRREVGLRQAVFHAAKASGGRPETSQAALIRRAVAEGASALIVVPDASPETTAAIGEIDRAKIPVILLGRTLSGKVDGPPVSVVDFPDVAAGARMVVDAVAEDAKTSGYPADAGVLLIKEPRPDETTAIRDAAIEAALKAKGYPVVATVAGDQDGMPLQSAIEAQFKDHPNIRLVVSDNDGGVSSATAFRKAANPRPAFLIGGFIRTRNNAILVDLGQVSAMVERNVDSLARRAVSSAFDALDGKAIPDRFVVDFPFRRSSRATNPFELK